jgi:signal transduction histidine kinase
VFPALIVLNAVSIPLAMPQIVLNVLLSIFYLSAVMLSQPFNSAQTVLTGTPGMRGTNQPGHTASAHSYPSGIAAANDTNRPQRQGGDAQARANRNVIPGNLYSDNPPDEVVTRQLVLLRVSVLWLLTLCCYGTQVLQERQREALREATEFAAREAQLQSAGRLAAEFAHRIKNPLAIINNAAYSLQRSLGGQPGAAGQQIEIIQEEVARADKVITQIMGYAQLSEGRVEKLKVTEEIERACDQVLPAAVSAGIRLTKHFSGPFPSLFMQRGHLAEILVNLLQNAREAVTARGTISVTAACSRDHAVEISVADDGPGIAPDKRERIFEAYFTTKEKGTGLGLAIVKHNVELYGGSVRAESVLGKGAKFTVILPAKSQSKTI